MVAEHRWTFLTNHAHVLLTVAGDPDIRVQHIADAVGISSRAALLILEDLEEAGYVRRDRVGRRNHYTLDTGRPFRHPATATHDVAELIAIFSADAGMDGLGEGAPTSEQSAGLGDDPPGTQDGPALRAVHHG